MKISIIQTDIAWGNPELNRQRLSSMIDEEVAREGASDLYVLPEMFSTGFAMEPEAVAESDGATLRWMAALTYRLNAAICGSVATEEKDQEEGVKRYFNRLYFVTPEGETTLYDKHHLFTFSGEHEHYTAGKDRSELTFCGVRFRLAICYDIRFPWWLRNRPEEPYDVLIVVASWPQSRRAVWDILLRARAIENQAYVVGVNRIGSDPSCDYDGGSAIISPYGGILVAASDNKSEIKSATIDLGRLYNFRRKFPVLNDSDPQ
ncbi:MAG: nitrilase family protein [Bacteroidales bacterium]|nr:nitrilase family protein [Bacteroidales bacterium]